MFFPRIVFQVLSLVPFFHHCIFPIVFLHGFISMFFPIFFLKSCFPVFSFKNCISSIFFSCTIPGCFFPEFAIFPECFFQYWFFNVYFSRAVFCQFFPARDYKFFPVCFFPELVVFPVRYIFSSAVFLPIFSCTLVFPECFFQNCSIFS